MAGAFDIKKSRGEGNNDPQENVVIKITKLNYEKRGKANTEKDWGEGLLMCSAFGGKLVAEFDEAGNPLTQVKFKLRNERKKDGGSEFKRREIADLVDRFNMSMPVQVPGGIIRLDRSFLDENGFVNGMYLQAIANEPEKDLERGFYGIQARVDDVRVRKDEKAGTENKSQRITLADTNNAIPFKGWDDFAANVGELLSNTGMGTPGFVVNGIHEDGSYLFSGEFFLNGERKGDDYVYEAVDVALKRFGEDNKEVAQFIKDFPDATWQIVPMLRFYKSKFLLDKGEPRPYFVEEVKTQKGSFPLHGWLPSHVGMSRKNDEAPWVVKSCVPQIRFGEKPSLTDELVTGLTPPAAVEAVAAAKAERLAKGGSTNDAGHGAEQDPNADAEHTLNPGM